MNLIIRTALSLVVFSLMGCATTSKVGWVNKKNPSGREGALLEMSDKVLCGNVAAGNTPAPSTREYMPVPSGGYTFSGQATTYGNSGIYNSQFSGTATPSGGFSRGFAQGHNMGIAIEQAYEQGRWRKTYDDCMAKLGWTRE